MRTVIYVLLVGYMSISGFLSLKSNDWEVRELPSFLNIGSSVDRVLPAEEWRSNLVGSWKFKTVGGAGVFKGTITFNEDSSFVRKVSYKRPNLQSGGTVRGRWYANGNKSWSEFKEECKFSTKSDLLCSYFSDEEKYGEFESDLRDYTVRYFNHDRIEIRAVTLAGGSSRIWRFTREE